MFNNGYGKKLLILIVIFLFIFIFTFMFIRVIFYRLDQLVPLIDLTIIPAIAFIIHLGVAIAKNRYGEKMKDINIPLKT